MSEETTDEIDDFHVITDSDFARYSFRNAQPLWRPLTEPRGIRLLKVFSKIDSRTFDEESIECKLEHWNLERASGKYEALSYAWGLPGNGYAYIQCDGVTTKIWRNLYQALLRLRDKISGGKTRRSRLVWVDALCIDQTEMEERQRQILLMKTIFGSASQVLIWLGEHDKTSRQVWNSMEGVKPGSATELIRNAIQWNVKMYDSFISRPWFRRVWTLQEVVLSSKATLLCGPDEMDWLLFCTIWKGRYEFMKNLKPEIRDRRTDHIQESLDFIGLMNCFDMHHSRFRNKDDASKTLPLSEIIIRTWYREATESHDRIYALLGLVDVGKYDGLQRPDYSQTAKKLFVNVTKTAMRIDGMPALLNLAGLDPEDMALAADTSETNGKLLTAQPTWVPDWTKHGWENNWLTTNLKSDDSNARMQPGLRMQSAFTSSFSAPESWTPIFEDDKLIIRGHIIGHLTQNRLTNSSRSDGTTASKFKVEGLSWGSSNELRWASDVLTEGKQYDIPSSRLPYDGKTTRESDVVCVFEGLRALFLVRMMFSFHWGSWGALEWLKEDVNYEGLKLNCLLIGPVQIADLELKENPQLGNGHWNFIIN